MQSPHDYIDQNLERFRAELLDWLRIPSISARPEYASDVRRAAEWASRSLADAGLNASVEETAGNSVVIGEWRGAGESAPTVLIYGHYDVQPAEPLELWTSPPFEPQIRDGRVYARGAVDDKGQCFLHVKAIEAHLRTRGRLPVNVVVLIEGEEEVGSGNLLPFVRDNASRLRADAVVISDTSMIAPNVPTIGASLRGLVYTEIIVDGPAHDLHSGTYGGTVMNPATALARIIATFHDDDGRVAVDGFYDAVDPDEEYRRLIRGLPFDEATYLAETGAPALAGEAGYSTLERLWLRPTLEVNGLVSGYTGEGPKTVLPSRALAKVSCRIVPNQDADTIAELLRAHVHRHVPPGVEVSVRVLQGGQPWRARFDTPLYAAAARALERAFGKAPVYAGEGGSIPIVPAFEEVLGAPVLLMGFALPGSNTHAPDEWMSLDNFDRGLHAAAALLDEIGH
ncbi:MAG TPA: dipeptidase [Longimicrobiales bacterium]|nr:dipeptidase [Longimicrobiales bacterium]